MEVRCGRATVSVARAGRVSARKHESDPQPPSMTDLCHGARNPRKASPVILLLSTSDTDLLSARASQEAGDGVSYRWANPSRLLVSEDLPPLLDGVDLVIVRILGSRRSWEDGLDMVLASGLPVVVLGGEHAPDADLMECSTVSAGVAAEAHNYLARVAHRIWHSCTTSFPTRSCSPATVSSRRPTCLPGGIADFAPDLDSASGPVIAVLYYRAQHLAGNTRYIQALCDAVAEAGGTALPIYCASLRTAEAELLSTLRRADAMVVTVLAAGGTKPATASAGGGRRSLGCRSTRCTRRPDPAGAVPDQ